MLTRVVILAATLSSWPALADEAIPYGAWQCNEKGVCIETRSAVVADQKVRTKALVFWRGINHAARYVRDCETGETYVVGVEGLPEKVDSDDKSFPWLCSLADPH